MPKIRRIFLSLLIKPVSASTIPSASPISFVAFDKSNSRIPGSSATSLLHSKPFQTITITARGIVGRRKKQQRVITRKIQVVRYSEKGWKNSC